MFDIRNHKRGFTNLTRTLAAVCALSVIGTGCSLLPREEAPLKPPLVKPVEVTSRTEPVRIDSVVKRVIGTAIFEPYILANHEFLESGGRVEEVLVRSGDSVKKGDPLIRLKLDGLDMERTRKQIDVEKKKLALQNAMETQEQGGIRIARLELELAEEELALIEERIDSRVLTSGMDGIVTFVDRLEPGDRVEAYRKTVTVADPTRMRLAFRVGSSKIVDVQLGMKAELEYDDQAFTGTVVQTPLSAPYTEDERLRDVYGQTLYIEMDEMPERMKMGAMVDVEITVAERNDVLVIPKSGLREYFGRVYVQVLDGESRVEIDVEKGLESDTEVEIVKGLEEGQEIILK